MTICEWEGCAAVATHSVNISFSEGSHETWQVCRTHDRQLKIHVSGSRPKAPQPSEIPPRVEVCCGACQQLLDESSALPEEERQSCPNCGSLTRLHKIILVETIGVHESIRVRSKQPGKGGWLRDYRTGEDYSRLLEGWGKLVRDVDKEKNTYCEVITFYEGTRLESTARLTDHRG